MNLVIFTRHYPYKPGEEFLETEMLELSKFFNKILIITSEKSLKNKMVENIPNNVEFIVINKNYKKVQTYLYSFLKLLSFRTCKEIFYGSKILNYKVNFKMIKTIYVYYIFTNARIFWIKENFDFLYENYIFYSYWLDDAAYTISVLKEKKIIPYAISRAHGGDAFLDRGYLPFRREIMKNLDEIHFVSETAKKLFDYKIKLSDISIGAKTLVTRLGSKKYSEEINPKKNEIDCISLISCSNIIQLKRLDLIIDALSLIDEYNIIWTHIGSGNLMPEIEELANKKLTKSNITYNFLGYLENKEILKLYSQTHFDLFINLSDYEGIPVSIMEAFSYGIPALARDVGGNSEIIYNLKNGFLLPNIVDPEIVAKKICEFIHLTNEKTEALRLNAYSTWKNKFDADKNYIRFANELSIKTALNKSIGENYET